MLYDYLGVPSNNTMETATTASIPCHRVSASTLVGAGGISAALAAILDVGKVKVAKTTHSPQL